MNDENFEHKGNSLLNSIRSLRKHTSPKQKKKIAGMSVLIFISAIMDVVGLAAVIPLISAGTDIKVIHSNPYLSAIFDHLGFESERSFVLFLIGVLFSYFIIKTFFGIFVNWMQARVASDIAVYITKNQFSKYYMLDFLDYNNVKSSVIMRNVLYNPTTYVQWIVHPMTMLMSETFIVLLIIGGIAYYDLFLFGFILVTIGPATLLVYRALRKKGANIGIGIDQVFPYALSTLTEAINGYIDIKLAGKEEKYKARYLKHLKSYQELQQSATLLGQIPLRTNEVIALMGIILIFIYAFFLSNGQANIVIMVGAFAAAAYRLMPSMNRILNALVYIHKNQVSIYNLDIYENLVKSSPDYLVQEKINFNSSIKFENISFSFPRSNKHIFKDLNIEVKKGEKIGFVGSSGSGKTTIMNILLRFYEESSGKILIDGIPLEQKNTDSWRRLIGYVKQDIFLLDGSIKDNITLGDTEVNEEMLMKAIKQSSLDQLVDSLPDGINSEIGEKGSSLSGGQRQRIGIARSLYRNAEILIFDEATSALDNKTESEVTESIDSLSETNKTIFIIAHRITTLRNCDRIYELKNGAIAG
ncbi:MAG TPA: ABC transporter ATP-binding protein, partial [Bacteroidia bacterium]|nr:ABC transporter ATP-binding protein [Bacteroidia bacterium]